GGLVDLGRDTLPAGPDAVALRRIDDPVLGPGAEARVTLRLRAAPDASAELRLTLFDDRPRFTYQLALAGRTAGGGGAGARGPRTPLRLDYLGADGPAFVLGDGARYLADASYVRTGELAGDGLWRTARVGIGKPAVVWGEAVPGGPAAADGDGGGPGSVVLSLLDEQRFPAWLGARPAPRPAAAAVRP